jgi:uncharacterized protein YcaQ
MTTLKLTLTQARRLAILRQGLAGPILRPTPDRVLEILDNLRCLQIDPIRAVERTQYLVLWSRLGQYDIAYLDDLLWREKRLFEYWAHAASIVLTKDYPIHQTHMRQLANGRLNSNWHRRVRTWMADNEQFRQYILNRLRTEGPLAASEFEDRSVRPWASDGWNDGRNVSQMLSFMWEQGQVMVAHRAGLRKKWALAEMHLPAWTPRRTLSERETVRQAAQWSLRALGVGTARQINNHFTRDRYPGLDQVLADLEAEQEILPVEIGDWAGKWYIHATDLPLLNSLEERWQPRTVLLSPFDNLIADRDRTELVWNFRFRIEIYVPKAKRQYGYYVLPILHGDRLIGRIDPKMDRKTKTLHINAVYAEPDAPQDRSTGRAIAREIEGLAEFLGAERIAYGDALATGWRGALR